MTCPGCGRDPSDYMTRVDSSTVSYSYEEYGSCPHERHMQIASWAIGAAFADGYESIEYESGRGH